MKSQVYQTEVRNEQDLRERITAAADSIRQKVGFFQRVRDNWLRRCALCVEVNGQHFENLL